MPHASAQGRTYSASRPSPPSHTHAPNAAKPLTTHGTAKSSRCRIRKLCMNRLECFLELVSYLHAKTVQVFLQLLGAGRANDVAGHERTRGDVLQRQLRG